MESSVHCRSKAAYRGSWPINKSALPYFTDKVKRELSITLYVAALITALTAITWMREDYFRLGGAVIAVGMGIGGKIIALSQREGLKIPIKLLPQEGIDWDLKVPIEHYSTIDEKMMPGDFFISEEGEIHVWDDTRNTEGELTRLPGRNKEETLTKFFEFHFAEYIDCEKDVHPRPFEDYIFSQWYTVNV